MNALAEKIRNIGIVPVVKIDDASKAVGLAKALIAGGIPTAEVTFRTAAAEEAIKLIVKNCPDMIVGAGTVINVEYAKKAIGAGAKFIVSPGFNPNVVDYCLKEGVTIIPGVNNPSGVEAGLEKGLDILKFFPAEDSGGVKMLDALAGPFPQVTFMPTGGIGLNNLADYAKRKNVLACGGTWMVKADLIEKEDWATITQISRDAVTQIHGFELAHIGINQENAEKAMEAAKMFALFGFPVKEGNSSIFNGSVIEVMKTNYLGKNGHIGFKTWNIERALAYLAQYGFKPNAETAKYEGEPKKSPLTVVYLDKEIAGFALHLIKAK